MMKMNMYKPNEHEREKLTRHDVKNSFMCPNYFNFKGSASTHEVIIVVTQYELNDHHVTVSSSINMKKNRFDRVKILVEHPQSQ